LATVQRAFRLVAAQTTLTPVPAAACRGRVYNRLNEGYRPLHALCAFFLEQSGPGHRPGAQEMVPFLVAMPRLFEQFVAGWLAARLGAGYQVASQVRLPVGGREGVHFAVDLVVTDEQGRPRWVLDTKYKTPAAGPEPADVAQVLAYAQVHGAPEAVLVYPAPSGQPLDAWVNGIRLRTLTFDLVGDLDAAGARFLAALQK
jgi:5-methylcytosine-specific restriction enzyme subunit McrC